MRMSSDLPSIGTYYFHGPARPILIMMSCEIAFGWHACTMKDASSYAYTV